MPPWVEGKGGAHATVRVPRVGFAGWLCRPGLTGMGVPLCLPTQQLPWPNTFGYLPQSGGGAITGV